MFANFFKLKCRLLETNKTCGFVREKTMQPFVQHLISFALFLKGTKLDLER